MSGDDLRDLPGPSTHASSLELESLFGYLLRRGIKQLSTVWNQAGGSELTIPQFSVLIELDRNPHLDQKTLGDNIWVDSSTVVDVCRRLISRGYLHKEDDPSDKRRNLLSLTEAGRSRLADAIPHVRHVDDALLAGLTPAERRRLIRLMGKLVTSWR